MAWIVSLEDEVRDLHERVSEMRRTLARHEDTMRIVSPDRWIAYRDRLRAELVDLERDLVIAQEEAAAELEHGGVS